MSFVSLVQDELAKSASIGPRLVLDWWKELVTCVFLGAGRVGDVRLWGLQVAAAQTAEGGRCQHRPGAGEAQGAVPLLNNWDVLTSE